MDLAFPMIFLLGYLLGSVPFGLLIAKSRGIDIRQHGSGNIGATNVLRVVGKPWGISVFLLDALKGVAAVLLARWLGQESANPVAMELLGGFACILGHNFPIWLAFKGGKGIATTAGVLATLLPVAVGVALLVWIVVFYLSRYVSLASIVAAVTVPLAVFAQEQQVTLLFGFSVVIALLAIWRHRSNIRRLVEGTENRFVRKKSL